MWPSAGAVIECPPSKPTIVTPVLRLAMTGSVRTQSVNVEECAQPQICQSMQLSTLSCFLCNGF